MVTGVGASAQVEAQRAAANEARRSNKPIMEKRRRARINNCLNELKTLILDAMKKDPARHSKLEKADILEMTVRHLEALQRQRAAADPAVLNKFRAGFTECAGEVGRFPGLDPAVRRRLLQHLASCLASSQNAAQQAQTQPQQQPAPTNIYLTTGAGLQLLPTRLPNGDIALVLPAQTPSSSPLPTLIPIPTRTASAASASSTVSTSSSSSSSSSTTSEAPPPSPEAPLALVTRRKSCEQQSQEEEKPWRPW